MIKTSLKLWAPFISGGPPKLSVSSHPRTQHPQVQGEGGGPVCDITDIYLLLGEVTSRNKPRLQRAFSLMGEAHWNKRLPELIDPTVSGRKTSQKDAQCVTGGFYIYGQWCPAQSHSCLTTNMNKKRVRKSTMSSGTAGSDLRAAPNGSGTPLGLCIVTLTSSRHAGLLPCLALFL